MELYETEEEQVEALKKWWKENGTSAIAGVVIGLLSLLGWNLWQDHKQSQAEKASADYQNLVKAVENKENESAIKLSERLIELYAATPYATFAHLFLAKLNVEIGDMAAAKKALQNLLDTNDDDNFKHIARLRLLRLMLSDGEAKSGLQLLSEIDTAGSGKFEGDYEEIKGDFHVVLNRKNEAVAAYQRALELGKNSPFLQMKINDITLPSLVNASE